MTFRSPTTAISRSITLGGARTGSTAGAGVTSDGADMAATLVEIAIRGQGQELDELSGEHQAVQDLRRFLVPPRSPLGQAGDLGVARAPVQVLGRGAAIVQLRALVDPLPELRAGDLRRRRVFHEVVDGRSAVLQEPGVEVLEGHVDVQPEAGL